MTQTDRTAVSIAIHQLADSIPRYDHTFRMSDVPDNGIYLMFEKGECVCLPEFEGDRIVRIGTHKKDGRLPIRLGTHFQGRRRTSVFRRHLNSALPSAGEESPVEAEVRITSVIADQFSFACLDVPELSERLMLEHGLIAQLAGFPIGLPSSDWLGHSASSPHVQASGLWNVQHLRAAPLTSSELDRLVTLSREA